MELWPAHSLKERKAERFHPNVANGLVEALTLTSKFEWTSLLKINDVNPARLQAKPPVKVFPATRSPDPPPTPARVSHRAEQGANFLRTHFPDVDITAELIREELNNDNDLTTELADFNPMHGNLIDSIMQFQSLTPRDAFLVFPMGELFSDLNISPIYPKNVFHPSAIPVCSFPTPITQIHSPNLADSILTVRTCNKAYVLQMKTDVPFAPTVIQLNEVSPSDLGGSQIMDIKLHSLFGAFATNDHGTVYTYDLAASTATEIGDNTGLNSDFWRIATTDSATSCLFLSEKTLRLLDTRVDAKFQELFSVRDSNETLTSVEPQDGHLIRLCSTSRLLWLDDRVPEKPLLGYTHDRHYDRTLQTHTVRIGNETLTFLTSLRSGLSDVYQVSRSHDNARIHVDYLPYNLSSASVPGLVGQTLVQYPNVDDTVNLFRLADDGCIHRLDWSLPNADDETTGKHEWSSGVMRLERKAASLRTDFGPLGHRDFIEEDFSGAYTCLHDLIAKREDAEDVQAHAVYELIDEAPKFWQDTNMPVEHMLNMYDVLFRAGEEPVQSYRSDFLTGSIINSKRGYRALQQGRLSANVLSKGASWHHDITNTLSKFDSTISNEIGQMSKRLEDFNLREDGLTAEARRWERKAKEQVSVDLALSTHIYSPRPFVPPSIVSGDLETMTEALSIGAEPPPVTFHYLQPVPKIESIGKQKREAESDDNEEDLDADMDPEEMSFPLGVRLLLKEWDAGSNPNDFVYTDPYSDAPRPVDDVKPKTSQLKAQAPTTLRPQAPPTIAVAGHPRPPHFTSSSSRAFFGSQPSIHATQWQLPTLGFSQESQEVMASTQVLPGPHGGRVPLPKKKPTKKRLGGF